jgi:hypothetical protein
VTQQTFPIAGSFPFRRSASASGKASKNRAFVMLSADWPSLHVRKPGRPGTFFFPVPAISRTETVKLIPALIESGGSDTEQGNP